MTVVLTIYLFINRQNEDDCKSNSSHTSTVDETRKQYNGNDVDNGYSVDATACSDLSPDSDIHKDVDSVFYQENGIVADNKDIIDEDDRLIRDISDHVLKGLNKESGNSWKGESDDRTLCTKLKNESDLDGSSEFTSLLDGGSKNDKYISWLDKCILTVLIPTNDNVHQNCGLFIAPCAFPQYEESGLVVA